MPVTQSMSLKDFFKKIIAPPVGLNVTGPGFSSRTQTLPNGAGSYKSPVPSQGGAPYGSIEYVSPDIPIYSRYGKNGSMDYASPEAAKAGSVPPQTTPPSVSGNRVFYGSGSISPTGSTTTPTAPQPLDYSKYINPKTGQPYSPKEYADVIASRAGKGTIPNYAADSYDEMARGDLSVDELMKKARLLNNERNAAATELEGGGPLGLESGIQWSPSQIRAIQNARAGIYDPVINDVFSRIEAKQKADEAKAAEELQAKKIDIDYRNDLTKMEKQFNYDKALKLLDSAKSSGVGTGVYVAGENPAVDAWAQRIFDGSAKITDIPASQKGMRDAVTLALVSAGNDLSGKPTVTELGKQGLAAAQELMRKLKAGEGTSAVGRSRIFGGSLAFPGTNKSEFIIDFQNLKDILSLDGVKYLKGQGAVSDAERALLANAVTKLNLSQSETGDFTATLQSIIDRLSGTENKQKEDDLGGQYTLGQIITGSDGKKYKVTGLSDPNDPDVEPI